MADETNSKIDIINVDLNGTIMATDSTDDNVSIEEQANERVSRSTEGEVYKKTDGTFFWVPCVESKCEDCPNINERHISTRTYHDFVKEYHYDERDALSRSFTNPGCPGEKFRGRYDSVISHIDTGELIFQSFVQFVQSLEKGCN